ncbi:MAG TPA: hypothetical protein VLE89_05225 [Chlamydiales bacterium]|nr:hypothetical protein [Chlamydiales bacterium]
MNDIKISSLIAFSLISSPIALSAASPFNAVSAETSFSRASLRKMKYQLAAAPVLQPMGIYVGELQERWQFPSDHLPIGMTFDGLNIASWNVLDADYMSWVTEKNSQGLSRSLIADEHVFIDDSKLTLRDRHVVDLILEMLQHPTHPKSLLSLQECREPFLAELKARLPSNFEVIAHGGNGVIIDRTHFEIVDAKSVTGIFSAEPKKSTQELILLRKENGEKLRLVNVHLPGDPTKPGRFEFAQYLADTADDQIATIAMGDMNFNELEMADALEKAFPNGKPSLYSPYCTNISPYTFVSKVIDHFIVQSSSQVEINTPEQVMIGLSSTTALLSGAENPVLDYSKIQLPHTGVLKTNGQFVYVDLDDDYIHKLVPLIEEEGFEEPPYFGSPGLVGAHISVIYDEEMELYSLPPIQELGETIHFQVKECKIVSPPKMKGVDKVYFIVVEAPELNRIREKYGLPKREHQFHITVGVKLL